MSDLFSDDPQFRRVQYTKLSDNVKDWPQQIGALVSERLPRELGLSVTTVFQKVNDEKGYAVGTAVITDPMSEKTVGVPVIVKSWHVGPFDMFFRGDKLMPLTAENLASAFFQSSVGTGIAPVKAPPTMADEAMTDTRLPPLGGKYSYSAPLSMIDLLSGTLGAEDLEEFRKVARDEQLLSAYSRRGNFELLCKYAAEKAVPAPTPKDRALAILKVQKNGPDKYSIWATADTEFDPILLHGDRRLLGDVLYQRKAMIGDATRDVMTDVDRYGESLLVPPESPYDRSDMGDVKTPALGGERRVPFVFNPLADDRAAQPISEFGRFGVRDKGGVIAKGWVIPNVVSLAGSATGYKLFVGQSVAALQNRIAGIPLGDDDDVVLRPSSPEPGRTGSFIYRKEKKIVATVPFQVISSTVYRGHVSLAVVDVEGNKANLILSPTVDGIVPVGNSQTLGPLLGKGKNYFFSAKMEFIHFPRISTVSAAPADFQKVAVEHALDAAPLHVHRANGSYVFRGGPATKYAMATKAMGMGMKPVADMGHPNSIGRLVGALKTPPKVVQKLALDMSALNRIEAELALRSWGLDAEKTAFVLDEAKNHIVLQVHHLPGPRQERLTKSATLRVAKGDLPTLVKAAAVIDDAETVDAVLSLGFVNQDNIDRFVAARPMLEEVSQLLCKLLLASRLGMRDLPEEALRSAIGQLQRVLEGLGKLKMLREKSAAA